ncbi:podocalyxin isoform X2 [Tyto alba]|uniref:podocalyxin isoform X2 n=1 Tax=Tyto alba TaxID=56313 RepID=UPI001C663DC5|nr:podocalyxin isoform X2 [Tyto alba]
MRAPLLLLPLLLLGVKSQDDTKTPPENPGGNGQIIMSANTSKIEGNTSTSSTGNPPPTSTMSPSIVQETTSESKLGNTETTAVIPSTSAQGTNTTSKLETPSSSPSTSLAEVQESTSTSNPGNPPPDPMTSARPPQQVSSSSGSGASTATPAAASTAAQKTIPPATLGNLTATTTASPVLTPVSSLSATPGGLGTAVSSSASMEAQASQPSDHLTSTTESTGVPRNDPGLKDNCVSSTTSAAKQPHPSSTSPDQGLTYSTGSGNISTSVTPFDGSMFPTTSTTSLPLPPGSINNVSKTATTPSPEADQRSCDTRSTSTTPASADQSPASAQPSAPAPGDQTVSSSPGHQHPNSSFQNEVICKDQEQQNRWPTMYLKEAKTCAEWRIASSKVSFFESFCSTGQHTFNASRETCTVTLTSCEPRSQCWAVWVVVHLPLDPEKVLEKLQKDKLEELGIVNITYNETKREIIINDEFSTPLIITIITLAGSLLLITAIYGCCHQRFSQKKDQHIHPDLPGFDDGHVALIFNRLTEELQTMENGYHDNPTLEVMETSSEMQEKKVNLNGELGDSWIVPLDTLMKEDLEEEEDTHL